MLCQDCLAVSVRKLHPEDVVLLEYLANKVANAPQCSVTKERIRKDTNLSAHHAYTALLRLECLDLILSQSWSRATRYFITNTGYEAIKLCNELMGGVQHV